MLPAARETNVSEHISDTDDFFSAYQNSEVADHGDTESLLEVFQGIMSGFFVEICQINDGAHYTLSIAPHEAQAWNCFEVDRAEAFAAPVRSLYRFETLEAAQGALSAFLRAAL